MSLLEGLYSEPQNAKYAKMVIHSNVIQTEKHILNSIFDSFGTCVFY